MKKLKIPTGDFIITFLNMGDGLIHFQVFFDTMDHNKAPNLYYDLTFNNGGCLLTTNTNTFTWGSKEDMINKSAFYDFCKEYYQEIIKS